MTPYALGRQEALSKYASAGIGALVGGVTGAALPQFTSSVWERPLRSLGGATLGAVLGSDGENTLDAAMSSAAGHLGGSVGGGVLGAFAGAGLERLGALPKGITDNSLGTLGGLAIGGTLGGVLGGYAGARSSEEQPTLETP